MVSWLEIRVPIKYTKLDLQKGNQYLWFCLFLIVNNLSWQLAQAIDGVCENIVYNLTWEMAQGAKILLYKQENVR